MQTCKERYLLYLVTIQVRIVRVTMPSKIRDQTKQFITNKKHITTCTKKKNKYYSYTQQKLIETIQKTMEKNTMLKKQKKHDDTIKNEKITRLEKELQESLEHNDTLQKENNNLQDEVIELKEKVDRGELLCGEVFCF